MGITMNQLSVWINKDEGKSRLTGCPFLLDQITIQDAIPFSIMLAEQRLPNGIRKIIFDCVGYYF